MKKKVIFTIFLILLFAIGIYVLIVSIDFIVKQSDINTAYFYHSRPTMDIKFSSMQEYIEYVNNGGKMIYYTYPTIIKASIIIVVDIVYIFGVFLSLVVLYSKKVKLNIKKYLE